VPATGPPSAVDGPGAGAPGAPGEPGAIRPAGSGAALTAAP
jgi:hypothetical protein